MAAGNDNGEWRAEAFVLALASLDSHPEQLGDNRPTGRAHGLKLNRVGWREGHDPEFTTQDPTAIIIGAGHNGLMLAARLRALGIPALTIERNERVGDNWRKRYSSVALHTPLASDGLPYLPYPPTWTRCTPKDKLGDFLECYATLLDLPVWTGSRVENVRFDDDSQRWTPDVVRADGSRRAMVTPHLVFATGMNGEPFLPDLPGMEEYQGKLIHAVDYRGHADWVGKTAGFGVSEGPDGQGVLGLIFGHNSTGYYYNAGPSELIADGTIKLSHGNVVGATSTGIALADGSTIDADLVIFAPG